jgi:hypothetical protein
LCQKDASNPSFLPLLAISALQTAYLIRPFPQIGHWAVQKKPPCIDFESINPNGKELPMISRLKSYRPTPALAAQGEFAKFALICATASNQPVSSKEARRRICGQLVKKAEALAEEYPELATDPVFISKIKYALGRCI